MKLLTYDEPSPYGKYRSLSYKDVGNSVFGKKEFGYIIIYGLNYREVIQEKWNERKKIKLNNKLENKLPIKNTKTKGKKI